MLILPVSAVAVEGVAPEQGDQISHMIDGTVDKVDGGMVHIDVTKVDGTDVESGENDEADDEKDQEPADSAEDNLRSMSATYDKSQGR
jgi:hypothetical protein